MKKDEKLKKTSKPNRKMTDWLVKKPVSSVRLGLDLDFGQQEMEVESKVDWGVANIVSGGAVPHPDVVQYHIGIRLAGERKLVAKKRQDDWWKNNSINNVIEAVLGSMWTGIKDNEHKRIIEKKEKIEKAAKLKSDLWANYNVTGVLRGIMEEAWMTITLEGDRRKEEKKLLAGVRRQKWLAAYRNDLMRKEVNFVLEMAWELHTFDYKIAEWRRDMDMSKMKAGEAANHATEMDSIVKLVKGLSIVTPDDLDLTELELDIVMKELDILEEMDVDWTATELMNISLEEEKFDSMIEDLNIDPEIPH